MTLSKRFKVADKANDWLVSQSLSPFIITDQNVAAHHLEDFLAQFYPLKPLVAVLEAGEHTKTYATAEKLITQLLQAGCDKNTCLVALGGGVVSDITGFVASIYLRGVPFVMVPTTLLAQADACLGGKTALNHPLLKNAIGTFCEPHLLVIDVDFLQTLPAREYHAGFAEVIKHALLSGDDFFVELESEVPLLLARDTATLQKTVERSLAVKAKFIATDKYDEGIRQQLNLGHTFAHALECLQEFSDWRHGEAVAVGLCLAVQLSEQLGRLSQGLLPRLQRLLASLHLPTQLPNLDIDHWLAIMARDKKARDGQSRFVVLNAIGQAEVVEVPLERIKSLVLYLYR